MVTWNTNQDDECEIKPGPCMDIFEAASAWAWHLFVIRTAICRHPPPPPQETSACRGNSVYRPLKYNIKHLILNDVIYVLIRTPTIHLYNERGLVMIYCNKCINTEE